MGQTVCLNKFLVLIDRRTNKHFNVASMCFQLCLLPTSRHKLMQHQDTCLLAALHCGICFASLALDLYDSEEL